MLVFGLGVISVAAALLAIALSGCAIGYPFRGPGFDAATRSVRPGIGDDVIVVVTQGAVAPGKQREFMKVLREVLDSMSEQDGLVGYSVRKELIGRTVWTISAWSDEESVRAFVRSDAHRAAMRSGTIPPESFISVQRVLAASDLPLSWPEAEALLSEAAVESREQPGPTHPHR
jgi:heme-degrading monooxygenase HmoA